MTWKIREEFKHMANPYHAQAYHKGESEGSGGQSSWVMDEFGDQISSIVGGGLDSIGNMGPIGGPDNSWMQEGQDALGGLYGGALGQLGNYWGDQLTGDPSRDALEAAKAANTNDAQNSLNQLLAGTSESANMAGGLGGSRQGIAEGMATTNVANSLNDQNARLEYQFQQDIINQRNNAAAGILGTMGAGSSAIHDMMNNAGAISNAEWKDDFVNSEVGQSIIKNLIMNGMLSGTAGLETNPVD